MNTLFDLLVAVIIGGIIFWLIKTFVPAAFATIALWIFAAICIIYLIGLLTGRTPRIFK